MAERITPRSEDFSQWYSDVIHHGKLADQSPVRGCMVLRPNGYALWEVVRENLDRMFKATGHQNAYFPMLIPESYLQKEKDHVEGFAPECAVVTHGGGKKLDEPLIIRPTSEVIINAMYSKWIKSYRDLPLLINQWANVVRWEMRPRPFLRTREFLWQEGHTCHDGEDDAKRETFRMLDIYRTFLQDVMAIPVIPGEKTESEKFAGAEKTYSLEAMMQDKKALQSATSHYFADRFARVFDIKFQDKEGKVRFVHQTSWGMSTRVIGAVIMVHSDDQGLVLPPKAAPNPVVLVPVLNKKQDNSEVLKVANRLREEIQKSHSVLLDDRVGQSLGFRFHEWEIQGIPLRIEVGLRDLAQNQVTFARRDGIKVQVKLEEVSTKVDETLSQFQKDLFVKASQFQKDNTHRVDDYREFKERLDSDGGFYEMHWNGSKEVEAKVKEDTKATIRCIPFGQDRRPGKCPVSGDPSTGRVIFARNY